MPSSPPTKRSKVNSDDDVTMTDTDTPLSVYPSPNDSALTEYKIKHAESVKDTSKFWGDIAKNSISWYAPFTQTVTGSFEEGDVGFFLNGKLNVCYNAVDRWVEAGHGDQTAVIWEGDEPGESKCFTFLELQKEICRAANMLKSQGVKKGDTVTIYMPMKIDIVVAMLACARIGAVHSVVFAGFSAEAIADRIEHSQSKFVCTSHYGQRGGKTLKLYNIIQSALDHEKVAGIVTHVFVFGSVDDGIPKQPRDILVDAVIEDYRPYCPCEWMDSEDNLFILYTSGSTGRPKGVVHTTGGYAVYAHYTSSTVFGLSAEKSAFGNQVYACVADAGWITGHTYIVYGPLLTGSSTFLFESTPVYPDEGRYWDMVQRHKISVFYTAPTAIRSLMRYGDDAPNKYDLSSLKLLGTVGEPINPAAWKWYYEVIGGSKCSVLDTYWQTETGGHIISNLPGVTPMKPGSCTLPLYGIDAVLLDPQTGKELEGSESGVLAIRQPWPGLTRTCLGDHKRYLSVYMSAYNGYYFPGDGCRRDEDGYIWITGRVDDVLNVSGHRIGTAEVESALVAHPAVSQAAVIGFPHDIKGQGICCYTTLTVGYEESAELIKQLRMAVRIAIGPFATPDMIVPTASLPMTRSGKIMRRILRKISSGEVESIGDTSTLADPSVVDKLVEKVKSLTSK